MAFDDEQRALAASCWQFVGITDDLAADGAWIRRTVFGTEIFIQRFDDDLRGFHNVCSHRGFPLRRAPSGSGPVQCGFHGWRYGKDGVPNHIPRNAELFGLSLEQRRALALPEIRVEALGRFVFAALGASVPPLDEFLGPFAHVYRAASAALGPVLSREAPTCAASWQCYVEISLDDYHVAAIHPTTFGTTEELAVVKAVYRRDGLHSSFLKRRDPDWSFDGFWRDVAGGTLDRTGYKIFNSFPNALLDVMPAVCIATAIVPLGPALTRVESYVFAWRDAIPSDEDAPNIASYFATVHREDRAACEAWREPREGPLGKLETRIGWFRENLRSLSEV